MQVFISYSRENVTFAEQLFQDLSDYDLKIWMDMHSIHHGANWDAEVQKGLDSSDLMVVLLSPASVSSQNVADEWSYFLEKNKPIVPLLIAPCDVPFRLSRRQRVDFTAKYQSGFQELIRAIGSPRLIDPESTQRIRPPATTRPPSQSRPAKAEPVAATANYAGQRPVAPEVGVRMLPVIWADVYHWFHGMKATGIAGEIMINPREIALIPRANPIITISLQSLISVKVQRSVDQYLKITYYGTGGVFKSLVIMGAVPKRRKEINQEIINLLKLLTGRSLD
jgi:hypothetical protein